MGNKPGSFFTFFNAVVSAVMAILVLVSLFTPWMKINGDRAATVKFTLEDMEVTTYNLEREIRTVTTGLSQYCDIDSNNAKCVLYKGSDATKGLLGVTLALNIICIIFGAIAFVVRHSSSFVVPGILTIVSSALGSVFSFFAFIVYTSYSHDFIKIKYAYSTGWTTSLLAMIAGILAIIFAVMGLCFCIS